MYFQVMQKNKASSKDIFEAASAQDALEQYALKRGVEVGGLQVERAYPFGKRGFASMDRRKIKGLAQKGGLAAHAQGVAHEWTKETGKAASLKSVAKRQAKNKLTW